MQRGCIPAQEATKAAAAYHAKLEAAEVKLEEAHKRFEAHKNALHQRLVDADAQRVALEGTWQRRQGLSGPCS